MIQGWPLYFPDCWMINQAISSWMEKRIDQPKNIKATGTNNACTFKKRIRLNPNPTCIKLLHLFKAGNSVKELAYKCNICNFFGNSDWSIWFSKFPVNDNSSNSVNNLVSLPTEVMFKSFNRRDVNFEYTDLIGMACSFGIGIVVVEFVVSDASVYFRCKVKLFLPLSKVSISRNLSEFLVYGKPMEVFKRSKKAADAEHFSFIAGYF